MPEYPGRTSPDCNGSHLVMLPPCLLSNSIPNSHTGGIWNLLAAESHRAIKPSKAHKRARGRTSNNVGPTGCQQTQHILNLNKPHCSFFLSSLSICVSLQTIPFVFWLPNPTWEWLKAEFKHFYPYMELVLILRELNTAQTTKTVEKQILMWQKKEKPAVKIPCHGRRALLRPHISLQLNAFRF